MTRPADESVRRQALDPARSFIVQAPAGSGKTELLIRRVLVLLSRVREPEEIIAITFTRKAAAEMRDRVVRALTDTAHDPVDARDAEFHAIARGARENDAQRRWHLVRHPSRLRIQTIDSLCAALTRLMPWMSGLGGPPRVVENASPLYRAAAEATLRLIASRRREWSEAASRLLAHLDNRVQRAVDLLTDMLRFRDQWLRHIGVAQIDAPGVRRALESIWQDQIRRELGSASFMLPRDLADEIADCAAYAARRLQSKGSDSRVVGWLGANGLPGDALSDLPRWRGLRDLLLTAEGKWRRSVNANNGFPAGKGHAADMKERVRGLLASLADNEPFRAALERVGNLPDPCFDDRQWGIISALATVLPLAAAQLRVLFGETGQVDFTEISMRANRALGSLDAPGDLAMRLDHRISHLLVDEFQDTSVSQFQIIESLTAGWQDQEQRSLFLVGDPMQSIYRFREAEVGLFLRVWERGMANIDLVPLTLTVNFRCDPQIVDWANRVFTTCFPASHDVDRGAVRYVGSTAHLPRRSDSGVQVHACVAPDPLEEARTVAELVREARRVDSGERIAVLVRSRQILRDILPVLDDAGIAYSGIDIQRLDWEPAVRDLLSLTRALWSPADRIAWFAVLRAPWCGLTLHDLHALVEESGARCVWDCIQDEDRVVRLSEDGRRRLQRFADTVRDAIEHRGRLPTWRSVENLWLALGGPACVRGGAEANARTYLDLLREHEGRADMQGPEEFERLIADHWAQAEDASRHGVQLMTLHKAKGLEFDTVIIPGLHRPPGSGEARLLLWEEQLHGGNPSLLFAPSTEIGAEQDPHYRYLKMLHAEKEHFETLRLLYVGCTRAKRRLHLLARVASGEDGQPATPVRSSLLDKLWPAIGGQFSDAARGKFSVAEAGPPAIRVLRRVPADWRLPELPSPVRASDRGGERWAGSAVEYSWAGETARHLGVIVHGVLDRMAREGMQRWDERRLAELRPVWRRELLRRGVPARESEAASRRILEAMIRVLGDERAAWLLDPRHDAARSEYSITWKRPDGMRNLRIDRTFIDRGRVRWIVEYKSSTHAGSGLQHFLDSEQRRYREQLDHYARAFQAMEARRIRCGLYFPLLTGWREWGFEDP